jgi:hypothetical protein
MRPERSLPPLSCARPQPPVAGLPDMFGFVIGWLIIIGLTGFMLLAFGADKLQIVIGTMQ